LAGVLRDPEVTASAVASALRSRCRGGHIGSRHV
jgi:hypothetical protein